MVQCLTGVLILQHYSLEKTLIQEAYTLLIKTSLQMYS